MSKWSLIWQIPLIIFNIACALWIAYCVIQGVIQ